MQLSQHWLLGGLGKKKRFWKQISTQICILGEILSMYFWNITAKHFKLEGEKKSLWIWGEFDKFHQKPYAPCSVTALLITQNTFLWILISSPRHFQAGTGWAEWLWFPLSRTFFIFPPNCNLCGDAVLPTLLWRRGCISLARAKYAACKGKSIADICIYVWAFINGDFGAGLMFSVAVPNTHSSLCSFLYSQ